MSPFRERFVNDYILHHQLEHDHLARLQELEKLLENRITDWNELPYIVVLGASMDLGPKGKRWKQPAIVESDFRRAVGGHSRAIAAARIYEEGYEGTFLVTGGTQYHNGQKISRAQVLAHKMIQAYHIPQEQIEVIGTEGNGNTLGNITNTVAYLEPHLPQLMGNQIGIMTNGWHEVRSALQFSSDVFFRCNEIGLSFISADDILDQISPQHAAWVADFNALPQMQEREELELQGINHFLNGYYAPQTK